MDTQAVAIRNLYNLFTSLPHRQIEPVINTMGVALDENPLDATLTLVWLAEKSVIRDLVDAAVVSLLKSNPEHQDTIREAGRCILLGEYAYQIEPAGQWSGLEPYRVLRILNALLSGTPKPTRLATSLLRDFLATLERDHGRADYIVAQNKNALGRLMVDRHISPEDFPFVSHLVFGDGSGGPINAAIAAIGRTTDPLEKATIGVQNKVPFRILLGLLPNTPETRIALIEAMTPQEALNSRAMLEKSGVLAIPEVKAVYLEKVRRATRSVATIEKRASAKGSDAEIDAAVSEARQTASQKYEISGDILLALDTSSSLQAGIEYAPKVASVIYPAAAAGGGHLDLVTFNTNTRAVAVTDTGDPYGDVKRALALYRPNGGTAMESVFSHIVRNTLTPAAVVFISDNESEENNFLRSYHDLCGRLGYTPRLIFILVGRGAPDLARVLDQAGVSYDLIRYTGEDDYALDQIPALLSGEAPKTIWEQIMEVKIPHRVK